MPSRTQVPTPPHSEACVLAHKWRLSPPNSAVTAPAAGTTTVFSRPPPSDGVQPWCRSCDFLFLGVPRSCYCRLRRRTATRPLSRHPAARLQKALLLGGPGAAPAPPGTRRNPWAAFICAGIHSVPALPSRGPRRWFASRARVSALPAACSSRRLRRVRL
ncbi:hypothetical protein NDU88_003303 [Pleurodeles waltl]|uniref:Uncharacterized protein n=1 Tax=Pleurodeles waltl TaxID=8319 RepID=A0AAV7PBQ4_PLEWA|nr:hypothetical protein NDU88_003303 [Pleurodeles waltl]